MRVYTNLFRALALLAWSAVSLGQQQGTPPPAPRQPEPRAETPAPPPAAEREEAPAPPAGPSDAAAEREFTPSEELAPDAAITFPVNI